jgi:hypothetical protein
MRVPDLIGESVRVSWREGGIVCPLDDQGDYLDPQQPLTPASGPVDRDGRGEAVVKDVGRPADLLHGALTACGLVDGMGPIKLAILGDRGFDRRALFLSCTSARGSASRQQPRVSEYSRRAARPRWSAQMFGLWRLGGPFRTGSRECVQ